MSIPKDLAKKRDEKAIAYYQYILTEDNKEPAITTYKHGFKAGVLAAFESEHVLALVEALEYYANQVEPKLEENYVSALALFHDLEHAETIQKIKLPAKEALDKWSNRHEV